MFALDLHLTTAKTSQLAAFARRFGMAADAIGGNDKALAWRWMR